MRTIAFAVMLGCGVASADPPAPTVAAIAVAGAFACARTHDAAVACWGDVPGGAQPTPAPIAGMTDVAGLVAAPGRLLAWTTAGSVLEWNGALTRVAIKDVVEVAVGVDAACARRRDGSVACWLGTNLPDDAITGATQIAVAGHQVCAIVGDDVSCWTIGRDPAKAEIVAAAHGAVSLAGHDRGAPTFVAAVPHRLAAWTWKSTVTAGVVDVGQRFALPVPALTDSTAVAIGDTESCALGLALTCWTDDENPVPRKLDAAGATAIALGDGFGCAAMPDRSVRCWGGSARSIVSTPVDVSGIADAAQLAGAGETACVRRANGHVACWGSRITEASRSRGIDLIPREVPDLADAREIFVGVRVACARRASGRVSCWGYDGTATRTKPTDIPALARASWLGVLEADVCGLVDGALVCGTRRDTQFAIPQGATELWRGSWYRGTYQCARVPGKPALVCEQSWSSRGGQLDVNPTTFGIELTDVAALQLPVMQQIPWVCVAKHGDVTCASITGDPSSANIAGVSGVTGFSEGPMHVFDGGGATCAVTSDHQVSCWSDLTNIWRVPAITDAVEVVGGDLFACARRTSGKVSCWGDSDFVSNAVPATTSTPALVPGVGL
ncbi:MAG TPA: hypothetical protein VH143_25425 [Kofleriaceae bacterium]|jgi:hypothetical protein|nr:hypothetical protein [Kofleriaceae bacterium]